MIRVSPLICFGFNVTKNWLANPTNKNVWIYLSFASLRWMWEGFIFVFFKCDRLHFHETAYFILMPWKNRWYASIWYFCFWCFILSFFSRRLQTFIAKLSSSSSFSLAVLVIFSFNPATHPTPTRTSINSP